MEFVLHGLSEYSLLSKSQIEYGTKFTDMLSGMFTHDEDDYESFDDENYY